MSQFSDSDPVSAQSYYKDLAGKPYAGDGGQDTRAHSDQDDLSGYSKTFLSQVNLISLEDQQVGGSQNTQERIAIDTSRAPRGKEV